MAHEWWHWGEDDWDTFRYDAPPDTSIPSQQIPSQDYNIPETDWGSQESISFGDTDDYVYQTPSQQYDPSSFLEYDPYRTGEGEFGGTISEEGYYKEQSEQLQDIPPEEEQSYFEMARKALAKYMPFVKSADQIQKFAKAMSTKRQKQGQGQGGGGRQVKAPYTTHKAGTSGRIQADIQSTFRGRDSRQLMALLSQQSRQAASGVQIVANKAADVGDPIKGNDLYDLISGETKPLGTKQLLPTAQSFRSLSIRRTQRA